MATVLTHISALEILRLVNFGKEGVDAFRCPRPSDIKPLTALRLQALRENRPFLSAPLYCGMEKESQRLSMNNEVLGRLLKEALPEGSFVFVDDGLYSVSPELCFLQLASECSVLELIQVGFELCGAYALQPGSYAGFEKRGCPPTSKKKIADFLERMKGARNIAAAQRALQYVQDNSASPMETACAMLLGLPHRFGGYNLGMPLMNYRIPLRQENEGFGPAYRKCDLFWPPNLGVEYDSALIHADKDQMEVDAVRNNDLVHKRVSVMRLTPKQVYVERALDKEAAQFASYLRKVINPRVKNFADKKKHLREVVLQRRVGFGGFSLGGASQDMGLGRGMGPEGHVYGAVLSKKAACHD